VVSCEELYSKRHILVKGNSFYAYSLTQTTHYYFCFSFIPAGAACEYASGTLAPPLADGVAAVPPEPLIADRLLPTADCAAFCAVVQRSRPTIRGRAANMLDGSDEAGGREKDAGGGFYCVPLPCH